ncbi:MAG: aromatic ring-hydroxylating dioxygenase subunit alpha [Rhodospirillales bacterium]|nr:aromatic ring-hydroxylating dioxygenase subunit alpha [Rhodospirillales bacterium]
MNPPIRAMAPRHYLDPEVFQREREAVFYKTWQFAAHASQVASPGDYYCFSLAGQNLFLLRGPDGKMRCFYNVCQHRAHEMLEGSGNRRVLVCPYHAWTYDLGGRLMKAPGDRRVVGFQRKDICLAQVQVEDLLGFLFVNLDPAAAPMEAWYPGLRDALARFVPGIDDLKPMEVRRQNEACNWKVSVENYSECYHCERVHTAFASGVIDPESYDISVNGGYCLRHTSVAANLERMSYSIDVSANETAGQYSSWFLWPAFSFQVYPGNLLNSYRWQAEAVDRVAIERGWYSKNGVESEEIARLAQQDMDTTVAEDVRLVESVQRGLKSRGYRPAPLIVDPAGGVRSEHSIAALYGWWEAAMDGRIGPA